MTIKQQGGIFGRNPTFNNVDVEGTLTVNGEPISDFGTMAQQDADSVNIDGGAIDGTTIGAATPAAATFNNVTVEATTDSTEELARFSNNSDTNRLLLEQQGSSGYALKSSVELRLHADYDDNSSAGGSNIKMYTDNVQRMSIAGVTGDVTIDTGNIVIGTSGNGIDFSATSGTGTSELFDDYEEGTWTPTDASGAGLSFASASGAYTKIGRMIIAQASIVYPSTADTSNSQIGGFPFLIASKGGGFSMYSSSTVGGCVFRNASNSTQVLVTKISDQDAVVKNNDLSGTTLQMTFTYQEGA